MTMIQFHGLKSQIINNIFFLKLKKTEILRLEKQEVVLRMEAM